MAVRVSPRRRPLVAWAAERIRDGWKIVAVKHDDRDDFPGSVRK